MGPRKADAMNGWSERQLKNLVYVGITRARHRLFIP
jgi:ATP-dependent exoDNAse (exonuclease V) beta subunit